ncbi:methyltransferase domain-containing protein [Nonomuraea basaltis]|uniref:methyltransferase domain-containing protein n=1 Tax=Nonomuraea basaltis TaxID=2495887 RepID=UPI00110C5C68|nr:class I SAM-dependent methyltransferase [Nonomuraea basaltis]TMR96114.1 methyltransferase domain-containing protein [Nonomuraea basaltis]
MTTTTDEFADRLFKAALGTIEVLSVHIGDRLGWYRALAAHGPADAGELTARAGGHERYAREWLEQQAAAGILEVAADGRFVLPKGAAEVLTDEASLAYLAPLARMLAGAAVQMPALLDAYRSGGGVGWATFGADVRESQADMNRPWFEHALPDALAGVPALDAVLRRPGARIADLGCGAGWSSIALARAYPEATVQGVDVDGPSIVLAERNAAAAGVGDRLSFRHSDTALLDDSRFDAVFAFECVHDMARPVDALAAARRAVAPGGTVVIMDEAVGDSFTAPADELERLMYGFSLLICLPDGMNDRPSAATGTVMRPDTLRRYAQEAGFGDIAILPIQDFGFWRFYQLIP